MSSEPDHQPEKESSLIKQPEHSNEPKTSKEVTELKVADKEIGQGDVVSSLNISETSPNDEMQDAKDDDIEVILDSADDDEDLHLKWDDDEEIEDDIISLNIPPSPIKEEIQSELKVLPEKDKEQVIDKDLADDELVVGTEGDEEIILMDDESDKVANTTPNSAEQSFQSMLLDIDNICAEIDNHTKTMDENQAKNKSTVKDVIKPSIIDDLILIEDDDITLDSVSSVKTENSLDENNIIKEMSYEQIEMDNNEKVGETQELDIKTNEQDVMEIDLLDDESEKPKEVISALVKDNSDEIISGSKSTGSTGTQMESDEMEKQKSDKSAAIKDNNDVIDSVFKVTETQLGSVESEKPKDVKIAVNEDTKDILAECKAPDVEMVEIDNSVNKPADDSVIENDIVASSPNESLLDPSCITENLEHGLNKPDMMLEIPTQEVIEFLDETDVSIDLNKSSESAEKVDIENEVTDNKTSSETNKNNIELTANSDSLPDPKKLEENSKLIDTIQNIQDSEQIKEIVAMDVTENIKDTVASETKLDNIKSKDENFTSTKDCEEEQTTELKDTDNASISESEIVVPHKPIDDTSSEYLKEKDLGTESEIIQHKPSDTDTIIEKDLNTESDIVVQETSANTTETIKLDSTLSKTVEVSSKTNLDKEKPSTSKEIKLVSPIEPQPSTSNVIEPEKCTQMELEPQPTTSQDPIELEKPSQMESEDIDPEKSNLEELGPQLLTSNVIELEKSNRISVDDELQEVTDSLGLLAESSGRVMDDDEEPEDEEDDDDFDQDQDQDESSNQMTAEHSEDSNAQQSETDGPKEPDEKITESPLEDKEEFNFDINSIVSVKGTEEEGKEDVVEKEGDMQERDGDVEVDDFVDEVEVTPEQIGDVSTAEEPTVPEDVPEDAEDVTEESAQDKPTEPKQAVEVETVKLSDTSDSDADAVSLLRNILEEQKKETPPTTDKKTSAKKVMVAEAKSASFNFVDLEESSSEDDVQEVKKKESTPTVLKTSAIEQDVAATEVPKTPTKTKTPRINTSEISIRTISSAEAAALPQIQPPEEKPAPKFGLEVFSLDSDEEDATKPAEPESIKPKEEPAKVKKHRCINLLCKSVGSRTFVKADAPTLAYYDAARKKRTMVCEECANAVVRRTQSLVDGIKEFTPLLLLDIAKVSSELVEISDSESEEEEIAEEPKVTEKIGELGVKLLEEHLADMINQTWKKFKLDARLTEAQDMLNDELKMLEEQSKEIDTMLTDCQVATDKLRKELYATFEQDRQELTPLIIFDIPTNKHSFLETESQPSAETTPSAKRRMSSGTETPAKRPHTDAIPLGYSPIENTTKDTTNVQDKSAATDSSKLDDDKDISVLQVSAEVAPPSLPPPGPLTRPPLRAGAAIFAMRNVFGSWLKGKILEVQGKATVPGCTHMFTICKVKFEHKARSVVKLLPGRCLAYCDAADVRMTIGTRVIALFKDTNDVKRDSFYSGIVAEVPNPVNKYRYLVFFDDGYAQYVRHEDTRLVCECASLVWEEVHPYSREYLVFFDDGYAQYVRHEDTRLVCECASLVWEEVHPYSREFVREYLDRMTEIFVYLVFFDDGYAQYVRHEDTRLVCECASLVWEEVHPYSREFVREYLMAYPERPMVRLHAGQSLKTEWNGKWWSSRVIQVDASLVHVHFEEDNRTEWIYRGSTRLAPLYLELQAAERHRARPMPRTKAQPRNNMPYVEYTRSDEQNKSEETAPPAPPTPAEEQRETRQRSVAKKSTTPAPASARAPFPAPAPPAPQPQVAENVTSRVVILTPFPAPAPPPPQPQVAENVTSRVVYYTPKNAVRPHKMVSHVCGPHCKRSDVLALKDLRTYNPLAKPLLSGWERQIVRLKGHKEVMYRAPCGRRVRNMRELHRYLRITLSDMAVDLFDFAPNTHCLAEFVLNSCLVGKKDLSHGKENVPVPCVNYYDDSLPEFCSYNTERTPTAGVPLNLDPEFLCGCDCTDDCEDKSKCACWRMTMEGARTIGMDSSNVGYVYRRLPEPLPTGIYECNSRCKCKQTCLNRVAQHPLQLKLQVFKTLNRGWGIRALNDVPKGSFLCVYAGNLLTDATANMDGLNEGDEYLAELDYIEVVEQMKEGYEEDIPNADKRLDKKNQGKPSDDDSEEISSSEEEDTNKDDQEDYDFRPAAGEPLTITQFSKRLRKREKKKMQEDARQKEKEKEAQQKNEDDCITISDDEEVREPSRFTATAGMVSNEFKSKYRSVRTWFGKDEACYIMDAKVQGNIGRYLNHSCTPNVFVQNVFVDTHDPRFPWVAFFALCHIKAGTELTWNYNYDVGSVPGKVLYCYCGAPNCRGRLL